MTASNDLRARTEKLRRDSAEMLIKFDVEMRLLEELESHLLSLMERWKAIRAETMEADDSPRS